MHNITLAQYDQLLFPPEEVKTVEQYRQHIREVLANTAPKKGPGRPPKPRHPFLSNEGFNELATVWKAEGYEAAIGPLARDQSTAEAATEVVIDNGSRYDVILDSSGAMTYPPMLLE